MQSTVWLDKSCLILLGPYVSTCKCSLQGFFGLVQGLWSPLHIWCWGPTRILPGHSTGNLYYGDPAAFSLWVRSLHMRQPIIDGVDVGAGQDITLNLVLGSYMIVVPDGNWGQLSHAHYFQGFSPIGLSPGSDLFCWHSWMPALLSQGWGSGIAFPLLWP